MTDAIEAYRRIFASRSPAQRRQLAQVKRFMERLCGDPRFRDRLRETAPDYGPVLRDYGIDADPDQMLPLFDARFRGYRYSDREGEWPLSKLWSDYVQDMLALRGVHRAQGESGGANPAFDDWRNRQILRSDSELGAHGDGIVHPVLALELSDGCSMGCWFCGISAEAFKGAWPYSPDNAQLWRGVVGAAQDLLGPAVRTGFCYWATDPMDNPDYDRFIADYADITGYLPQTTTAAPLKDLALTRRVLDLFEERGCIANRFSILNLKQLDKVHAAFTADELMGVELVLQNRESIEGRKSAAGRVRDRQSRLNASGRTDGQVQRALADATIACVSGFLINMPNQEIRLVSPTRPSERWPLGYRIHDRVRFETASEFRTALQGLIDKHCTIELAGADVLAFRPDLTCAVTPEGVVLTTAMTRQVLSGDHTMRRVAELIAEGRHTAGSIHAVLIGEGEDPFLIGAQMRRLFQAGLLDEDPVYGGIGTGRPPVLLDMAANAQ